MHSFKFKADFARVARGLPSFAALLGACALAHGQAVAPSQVTPPSLQPEVPRFSPSELVIPPGTEPEMRAGDSLDVQVQQVQVEGGLPQLEDAASDMAQALQGRRVTLMEINRRAALLEDAYHQRGYFLVRVTLPPQRLRDGGTLRIVVLDGFIEEVDASAVPERVRETVRRILQPLAGQRGLRLDEAERRLRVAGSLAGLRLISALTAGEQPGGSRLLLEGQLRDASASLTVDNGLAASLGSAQMLLSLSLNSPFGQGERLYAALGTGRPMGGWASGEAPLALGAAGLIVPLGTDGWTFNPEFTHTTLNPEPVRDGLRMRGQLSRAALRFESPLVTGKDGTGSAQVILERVAQRQAAPDFGFTVSSDRYNALRAGLDGTTGIDNEGGNLSASAQWSQGLGGREPQPSSADSPLSRQGASPRFSRLNALLRLNESLGSRANLALMAAGQISFGDPLLVSEQFALSGADKVSGRPAGGLSVDEGLTLRAELSWSLPAALTGGVRPAVATPYAFAAAGLGRLLQPTAVEQARLQARSAGFGLRAATLNSTGLQAQLAAEMARCWAAPDDDGQRWRLSVRLSVFM